MSLKTKGKVFIAFLLTLIGVTIMCACSGKQRKYYETPEAETEQQVNLVWEGKRNYAIIYGKDATASEKTAAKELQKYLKKMTGAELWLADDASEPEGEYEILVGKTNREENGGYSVDREDLGTDGFEIKWAGKKLIIAGGEVRGTLYGVYDFLEQLGCRFFSTDTEVVPSVETLTLDTTQATKEKPAFEYRDLFWTCTFDEVISAKMRLNGSVISGENGRMISDAYGNGLEYAGDHFVHTFHYLVPPEEYFEEHPEYYSEIDGKRTSEYLYSQLCLTNPDVLQITIDKVREWLRANPNAKIVSVSQDDSYVINSFCTCEECSEVNKEERSNSGTLIRFVNAVADAIKDEFPDVAVDTLAYQYSIEPPRKTKPRDNVIVRVCTGVCSAHAIGQCSSSGNISTVIRRWAKISDRIYIWDYTTDFAEYLCPFPNLNSLQGTVQFFAENNVKGVFEQGNYQEGKSGEFGELRAYLLAKLLWDPYTDITVHTREFMEAYYGEAAGSVQSYIDYIHKVIADSGKCFNLVVQAPALFEGLISDEDLAMLDGLWEEAKAAVSDTQLAHVRRSELQWRWYKMRSQRGEFADAANYGTLENAFYADCNELGVLRTSEGANVPWIS